MDGGGLGHRPAVPYDAKMPCAAAPRAWTTRSGMRSWSKWVIGIGQPQGLRRGEELARLVLADIG
jgi:hypothetical protein